MRGNLAQQAAVRRTLQLLEEVRLGRQLVRGLYFHIADWAARTSYRPSWSATPASWAWSGQRTPPDTPLRLTAQHVEERIGGAGRRPESLRGLLMNIAQSFGVFLQSLADAVGSLDLNRVWESRNTTLMLGWIIGVFTTPVAEFVKDRRRQRQLAVAIHRELQELQYQLALVSFTTEIDFGDGFNRDYIIRTKQLISGYGGANVDPKMMENVDRFLKMTDDQIAGYVAHSQAKNIGQVIPPFETRYLDSVMGDLRLFSRDFQTRLMSIRTDLGMLNFHIRTATEYERFTFTLTDAHNHKVVGDNNRKSLKAVARLGRRVAEKIEALYPA